MNAIITAATSYDEAEYRYDCMVGMAIYFLKRNQTKYRL